MPSGADNAEVAFEVASRGGGQVDRCYGGRFDPGCIVARRALRYLPVTDLRLPIVMRDACRGVECPPGETCVQGDCRSAWIDPEQCAGDQGCGEHLLPPGGSGGPTTAWASTFNCASEDYGMAVAVDEPGNVYLTGQFGGSFDLGAGSWDAGGAARDGYVVSYTADGTLRWARQLDTDGQVHPVTLAASGDGAVYVGGQLSGTLTIDGEPFVSSGEPADQDAFVARLRQSDGAVEWVVVHRCTNMAIYDALVARDGHLYGAGSFSGDWTIGDATLPLQGGGELALVSLQPSDGQPAWARASGGLGIESAAGLSLGDDGRLHVVGTFMDQTNVGTVVLDYLGGGVFTNGFYAAHDPVAGTWDGWALSGPGPIAPKAVVIDSAGRACVAGDFRDDLQVGAFSLTASQSSDLFVVCFEANGPSWARQFGRDGVEQTLGDLVGDGQGRLYLVGRSDDDFDFGATTLHNPLDTYLGFFGVLQSSTGEPEWGHAFSSSGQVYPISTAHDPSGTRDALYVTGNFNGAVTFDETDLSSLGMGADGFLAKIPLSPP